MIVSESITENLNTLRQVLLLFKSYGFELDYDKCQFLKQKVEYVITKDGITMNDLHTEAISNFPLPKSVNEVQRFLGLTNYIRRFIKDYASIAKPLYHLTRKSVDFVFYSDCMKAFEIFKRELIAYPILRLYNPKAETELHTDASARGLAAILPAADAAAK